MSRSARAEEVLATPDEGAGGLALLPHDAILSVRNLEVVYHDVVLTLRGVSLDVPRGTIVALLGANGAGKTTTLRAITGLLDVHQGKITKGSVTIDGDEVTRADASTVVAHGVAQVMEGRRTFAELTVDENLRTGAVVVKERRRVQESYDQVMDLFPVLRDRRHTAAGYLSGGEQQMLVIGRALMSSPRLLLLDEPSLGLAPLIVEQIRDIIVDVNRRGTSVLLVEQNAAMALSIAVHGYVMETGKIVRDGPAAELLADKDIREFYLGIGETGRRSFKDVKSYRRKKHWGS